MNDINYYKFQSQLALPFLETSKDLLGIIFAELQDKFGLKKGSKQKFVDLGSGDGRVVIYASMACELKSLGIEIDEKLVNDARNTVKELRAEKVLKKRVARLIRFKIGDMFEQDLKKFDFVYIFSLPSMQKYLRHVFFTMKPDGVVISHKYPLEMNGSLLRLDYQLESAIKDRKTSTFFYVKL